MPASRKPSTLKEFREKHFAELDENIRVWKSIRDNDGAAARDRNEAAKCIQRALGALSPDHSAKTTGTATSPADTTLTPEEEAKIQAFLESK